MEINNIPCRGIGKREGKCPDKGIAENDGLCDFCHRREQNNAACRRYKKRKKREEDALEKMTKEHKERVEILKKRAEELEQENAELKKMLTAPSTGTGAGTVTATQGYQQSPQSFDYGDDSVNCMACHNNCTRFLYHPTKGYVCFDCYYN